MTTEDEGWSRTTLVQQLWSTKKGNGIIGRRKGSAKGIQATDRHASCWSILTHQGGNRDNTLQEQGQGRGIPAPGKCLCDTWWCRCCRSRRSIHLISTSLCGASKIRRACRVGRRQLRYWRHPYRACLPRGGSSSHAKGMRFRKRVFQGWDGSVTLSRYT